MWKREVRGPERIVGLLAIIGERRGVVNAVRRRPEVKDSEKWIRGVRRLRFLVGSGVQNAQFPKKNAVGGLVR